MPIKRRRFRVEKSGGEEYLIEENPLSRRVARGLLKLIAGIVIGVLAAEASPYVHPLLHEFSDLAVSAGQNLHLF